MHPIRRLGHSLFRRGLLLTPSILMLLLLAYSNDRTADLTPGARQRRLVLIWTQLVWRILPNLADEIHGCLTIEGPRHF